jgi:hypothetical protein
MLDDCWGKGENWIEARGVERHDRESLFRSGTMIAKAKDSNHFISRCAPFGAETSLEGIGHAEENNQQIPSLPRLRKLAFIPSP